MGRHYSRIHRLMQLIHLIHGRRGLTGGELAREFETTDRNIRRDIQCLKDIGIPCYYDRASRGYVVRKGFFLPPVEFTFEEALSLLLLMEHLPAAGQIPHLAIARRAMQKIRSQLRDDIKAAIEPLDGKIEIDLARGSGDDGSRDVYEKVRAAIATRRVLACRYDANHSAQKDSHEELFDFRPYLLWYAQRAWYVIGWHGGRKNVRQLRLNRFDFVQVTEKPYAIPDDFSIKKYLGNAWRMIRGETDCRVVIRFDPGYATTASETRWHPTQVEEEWHKDGGVTLSFLVSGLEEIKWFVLGYGPYAKVLEPPELAKQVWDLAQATARRYGAGP